MKIITLEQAKNIQFDELSIALGTFDGLHVGHMALINALRRHMGTSAVYTFDSLPMDLFSADHKPMRLFTLEEKIAAFEKTGIDYLCITHFDKRFADMDKEDFTALMLKVFTPQNVIAGYNYTYGKQAQGNVDTLKQYGLKNGYNLDVIPPVMLDGEPISSTRIREYISTGSVDMATVLLGYPYCICGTVIKGRGIGNKLGYPTANISVAKEKIVPLTGVYSVQVIVGKDQYNGVCNIGVNPTVSNGARKTIEVHIISMSKDIYGKIIKVYFRKRLRGEKKFKDTDALKAQIKCDIDSFASTTRQIH